MIRYLKIKGKLGMLVEGPEVDAFPAGARRYLGQRAIPNPPKGARLHECFEPCEQVVKDDPWRLVRNACRDGDLELLGECVAGDMSDAMAKMLGPKSSEAKRKDAADKAK